MTKICYVPRKFNSSNQGLIDRTNGVIEEYEAKGIALTLRTLYYQMVARAIIPNNLQAYKHFASVVNDARMAGLIDWESIDDNLRSVERISTWETTQDIMSDTAAAFRLDPWERHQVVPEVWIEKDALAGVIDGPCRELRVPYFACRGYTSQSAQWRAAMRFAAIIKRGGQPVIFHLGDHDPSGIDMTRDNQDRLTLFLEHHLDCSIPVKRLALNYEQVEQYNPPPNPAKLSDSRANGYIARHGDESWELDALDPEVIGDLIRDAVEGVREPEVWDEVMAEEEEHRRRLRLVHDQWSDVLLMVEPPPAPPPKKVSRKSRKPRK